MPHDELRQRVLRANLALVEAGLVTLTWGNASAADRRAGIVAIKPSGVPYDRLTADDIVIVSLPGGRTVEGAAKPSSDTPTHLHLYETFPDIGGIVHTHSTHATAFAQAGREIPPLGTTHADHFYGPVPVARPLTEAEVAKDYELHTGRVIAECFRGRGIDPMQVPAALVHGHGPFAWGQTVEHAVENAIALEHCAQMAALTWQLDPPACTIPQYLLDKHFLRKHGPNATYGQR